LLSWRKALRQAVEQGSIPTDLAGVSYEVQEEIFRIQQDIRRDAKQVAKEEAAQVGWGDLCPLDIGHFVQVVHEAYPVILKRLRGNTATLQGRYGTFKRDKSQVRRVCYATQTGWLVTRQIDDVENQCLVMGALVGTEAVKAAYPDTTAWERICTEQDHSEVFNSRVEDGQTGNLYSVAVRARLVTVPVENVRVVVIGITDHPVSGTEAAR